jgi:hypothetical protein
MMPPLLRLQQQKKNRTRGNLVEIVGSGIIEVTEGETMKEEKMMKMTVMVKRKKVEWTCIIQTMNRLGGH